MNISTIGVCSCQACIIFFYPIKRKSVIIYCIDGYATFIVFMVPSISKLKLGFVDRFTGNLISTTKGVMFCKEIHETAF